MKLPCKGAACHRNMQRTGQRCSGHHCAARATAWQLATAVARHKALKANSCVNGKDSRSNAMSVIVARCTSAWRLVLQGCQRHSYLANGFDPAWGEYGGDALPPGQRFSEPVHPWMGQPRPAQITVVRQRAPSKPCARVGGFRVRRRDWVPLL